MWSFYGKRGELVRKQNFKDHLPNGKWIEYYPNGIKQREGSYENLAKTGVWTYYDEKGEITYQVLYKNNMIFKVLKDKKPNNKTSPEINTKIR
jgi:antitoxin component YwqK of YwqJK toxin-antitoxin module